MKKSRAQTIIEYSVILGVVTAALLVMQFYLKRGIQAGIRVSADQLGLQTDDGALPYADPQEGYVEASRIEVRTPYPSTVAREVFAGGRQATTVADSRESKIDLDPNQPGLQPATAERKDAGWYYVDGQLHRRGKF